MAERTVLMRHPCIFEEVAAKFPLSEPDTAFKPWNLVDDPRYMIDPVEGLVEILHEKLRLARLAQGTILDRWATFREQTQHLQVITE